MGKKLVRKVAVRELWLKRRRVVAWTFRYDSFLRASLLRRLQTLNGICSLMQGQKLTQKLRKFMMHVTATHTQTPGLVSSNYLVYRTAGNFVREK